MGDYLLVDLYRGDGRFVPPVEPAAALNSGSFTLQNLTRFALWNDSAWALGCISALITQGLMDWPQLRAALIASQADSSAASNALGAIPVDDLFALWEAIGAGRDTTLETALLSRIAQSIVEGCELPEDTVARVVAGLLRLNRHDYARELSSRLTSGSWAHDVAEMELSHPRFGGSPEEVVARLDAVYRGVGLASVMLCGEGDTPFARLRGAPDREERGPLVTVIMSAWQPGEEIFTAVRSVIDQTYQDWELVVTDDASGDEYDEVFEKLASLDARVRVIRNVTNLGTYARRNEVLRDAGGAFVTFQDSDDWSHPSRLEIQVRDLLEHPDRIGNVVRHARATDDLSFATNRGMALTLTEPSIMFRRAASLSAAGFYDSVRKGADREYRLRLEVTSGSTVELVGPEVPLQLMLASASSLSGSDFGPGWMVPARVAYRNACDLYHARIKEGKEPGRLAYPQVSRRIAAPPEFLGAATYQAITLDVLLVLDGRASRARTDFLAQVVAEIKTALSEGLSVGLFHSDAPGGRAGGPRLAPQLQALINDDLITQVLDEDAVRAGLVVIRHASAVQGHIGSRRPIAVSRSVIVEDAAGGDVPGMTISVAQVVDTVTGWMALAPNWVSLESWVPPRPSARRQASQVTTVMAAWGAPSARLKYEDQVTSAPDDGTVVRYQRTRGPVEAADVVHGVGRMDQFLSLTVRSTPQERLDRTRRFADKLSDSRTALVRTLYGPEVAPLSLLEAEAVRILDAATARFIVVDGATATPDTARTVVIPFADPRELYAGYPVSGQVKGRLLSVAGDAAGALSQKVLSTFFVTRTPGLTLRIVGADDDALTTELRRAIGRSPGLISHRLELLSDAALVEEITSAEFVLVPELLSLEDYQLAMLALGFDRPVISPASEALASLRATVGEGWVFPLDEPVTARALDSVVARARETPRDAGPDLAGRGWINTGRSYSQVVRDVLGGMGAEIETGIFRNESETTDAPARGGLGEKAE